MLALTYSGQRVLTTDQLATIYSTDIKNLQMNYLNHKDWFESGRHFFDLKGDELKAFKRQLNEIQAVPMNRPNEIWSVVEMVETPDDEMLNIPLPTIGKQANAVKLWTRRGLIRHSHFLTTAAALQITERLEDVYFNMLEGKQSAIDEPKPLTLNGRKVCTLKQASRMLNRPTKQIQKALYGRRFTRGTDFFVTDQRQLEQLSAENGQWFAKKLTLILESGLSKLRMMYVEGVKAPSEEMLKELRSKVEAVMKAALDVNVFLSERSLVEA